jgi:alpha-tubulin suppressor-like RCC1 family protein
MVILESRTREVITFAALSLLSACKVFDSSLLPDGGGGTGLDAGCDQAEVCNGRDDNCNDEIDEGIETATDEENCGGCGKVCSFLHSASGECVDSECRNTCDGGWDDCDNSRLNGCEADLSSKATCSSCDVSCTFACASDACVTGTSIAAGRTWTCVTFSGEREARCWGANGSGQLGTGDTQPTVVPRNVMGLTGAKRISAAFGHTCAALDGRVANCWGENDRGQLGDGTMALRSAPVPVNMAAVVDSIAVGNGHTCARSGQDVFCWGFNDAGQLGFGDMTNRPTPTKLPNANTGSVVDVGVGLAHTCAVQSGGDVICWGWNDQGQVGTSNEASGGTNRVLNPNIVPGIADATQISIGHAHSCARTAGGKVRCWGWNASGQLGDGGFMSSSASKPVILQTGAELTNIERVVAGARRTCAIAQNGDAYCWGDNTAGALGNRAGETGPGPTQTPVATKVNVVSSEVLDIAVGEFHTCFLGGVSIVCVGQNTEGQLGNGTTTLSTSGVEVSL